MKTNRKSLIGQLAFLLSIIAFGLSILRPYVIPWWEQDAERWAFIAIFAISILSILFAIISIMMKQKLILSGWAILCSLLVLFFWYIGIISSML